jgi:hypothetical protein
VDFHPDILLSPFKINIFNAFNKIAGYNYAMICEYTIATIVSMECSALKITYAYTRNGEA